ncbi:MAG: hypothetical protein R6X02_14465 [Enhygromyxa sp.]
MPKLRNGTRTSDARLSRVAWYDEASRRYPVRELLDLDRPLTSKTWRCALVLDQERQGACTGFAVTHALAAAPHPRRAGLDATFARETIYWAAQKLDPFEGGAYPGATRHTTGGSLLAAAKVLRARGLIREYRWAFDLDEVLYTISQLGPVVLGVPWYEGMSEPACCGMLHPTGRRKGAHAVLARGVDLRRRTVLLHNSWGRGWGRRGTALMHWEDLAGLLTRSKDAEACVLLKPSSGCGPA